MALVGIDLGGTKLLALAVGADGAAIHHMRATTGRTMGPDAALAAIERAVTEARAHGDIEAIGVGFPGLVDHARGVARSSVMLDGWRDVPLAALLEERLGVPCAVDNDVNAAALHELELRGAPDMLFAAVGTGIGGALVLGGCLHRGRGGFAGEIGHVVIERDGRPCDCGRRGCVNRYASGTAIEAEVGLEAGALRARAGHAVDVAAASLAAGAAALGVAIGSALNLLDVPLVVLGGGVAQLGPAYVAAVAASARRECFSEIGRDCLFEAARGGYDGAALGAVALAAQRLEAAGHACSRASRSSSAAYSRASRSAADG
ncbi:MAG TPA: ROK family protein [Kofleriaceae bacterium]|nr:ROK family protein [Kofleriaceae bacterium]